MNAFMAFSLSKRRQQKKDDHNVHHAVFSQNMGKLWKSMSPDEQFPYKEEAKRLKMLHAIEYPDYKYKPKKKSTARSCLLRNTSPNSGRVTKKRIQQKKQIKFSSISEGEISSRISPANTETISPTVERPLSPLSISCSNYSYMPETPESSKSPSDCIDAHQRQSSPELLTFGSLIDTPDFSNCSDRYGSDDTVEEDKKSKSMLSIASTQFCTAIQLDNNNSVLPTPPSSPQAAVHVTPPTTPAQINLRSSIPPKHCLVTESKDDFLVKTPSKYTPELSSIKNFPMVVLKKNLLTAQSQCPQPSSQSFSSPSAIHQLSPNINSSAFISSTPIKVEQEVMDDASERFSDAWKPSFVGEPGTSDLSFDHNYTRDTTFTFTTSVACEFPQQSVFFNAVDCPSNQFKQAFSFNNIVTPTTYFSTNDSFNNFSPQKDIDIFGIGLDETFTNDYLYDFSSSELEQYLDPVMVKSEPASAQELPVRSDLRHDRDPVLASVSIQNFL